MNSRELQRDIAGCSQCHLRLMAAIEGLADHQARRASLLDGWSVGHVITHLARNADSHIAMFEAADRGEVGLQYRSPQARQADIEAGAGRSAVELVADLQRANQRLERWWTTAGPLVWAGEGRNVSGVIPIGDLPFRRWREAEIHLTDLGLGPTPADWSAEYVRLETQRSSMQWASRRAMGMTDLPAQVAALDDRTRLAWLVGRTSIDGVDPAGLF